MAKRFFKPIVLFNDPSPATSPLKYNAQQSHLSTNTPQPPPALPVDAFSGQLGSLSVSPSPSKHSSPQSTRSIHSKDSNESEDEDGDKDAYAADPASRPKDLDMEMDMDTDPQVDLDPKRIQQQHTASIDKSNIEKGDSQELEDVDKHNHQRDPSGQSITSMLTMSISKKTMDPFSATSVVSPPSSYSSNSSSMEVLAKTLSPARVDMHRKKVQRMLQQNSLLWWELVRYTRNLEKKEREQEQEQEKGSDSTVDHKNRQDNLNTNHLHVVSNHINRASHILMNLITNCSIAAEIRTSHDHMAPWMTTHRLFSIHLEEEEEDQDMTKPPPPSAATATAAFAFEIISIYGISAKARATTSNEIPGPSTSGPSDNNTTPAPSSSNATATAEPNDNNNNNTVNGSGGHSVDLNRKRRGNLPKSVTSVLKSWLVQNAIHPYPTEEEKMRLSEATQLSMNQISNWFINARRRILQPILVEAAAAAVAGTDAPMDNVLIVRKGKGSRMQVEMECACATGSSAQGQNQSQEQGQQNQQPQNEQTQSQQKPQLQ
ncbi:hypothetical protein BGX27_005097 [Mortierella sp. AM989]|nr:hypothetical protein BGX27_005097 [Mortierella sp. AM989]